MDRTTPETIRLGSGELYLTEFDGQVMPTIETICKPANILGYVKNGASLEYSGTWYEAKDDLGKVSKQVLTDENVILKSGLITFNPYTLNTLTDTGRVTEDVKRRTIKIGGLSNARRQRYVLCFHHRDPVDGDIWIRIVGQNQAGFTLTFAKDSETVIDAEFKAIPHDNDGTLVIYDEEIKETAESGD